MMKSGPAHMHSYMLQRRGLRKEAGETHPEARRRRRKRRRSRTRGYCSRQRGFKCLQVSA